MLSEAIFKLAQMTRSPGAADGGGAAAAARDRELRDCVQLLRCARDREIESQRALRIFGVRITKPRLGRLAATTAFSLLTAMLRAVMDSQ